MATLYRMAGIALALDVDIVSLDAPKIPEICRVGRQINGIHLSTRGLRVIRQMALIDIAPVDFYKRLTTMPYLKAIGCELYRRLNESKSSPRWLDGDLTSENLLEVFALQCKEYQLRNPSAVGFMVGDVPPADALVVFAINDKTDKAYLQMLAGKDVSVVHEGSLDELLAAGDAAQKVIAEEMAAAESVERKYRDLYKQSLKETLLDRWLADEVALMSPKQLEVWQGEFLRTTKPNKEQLEKLMKEAGIEP